MVNKRYFGNTGESYAAELLKSRGYKILEKNFRSKFGEIDIIALDADTIVFVEVKTRHSMKFGLPEEAVNAYKLQKIRRVSDYYVLTHPKTPKKLRIDVVAILVDKGKVSRAKVIKVI